ncbi:MULTISPECIES: (2Fe-2S)-binding protein [Pimelobacter]|uniref:(2Fe-2S)-binding protein n=1 Tax=Nocardioides simplex TaxID=2045 RepID=A0A7J5E437_NOCSI|nr:MULTISPECIES: (2Fe-2S)-binding protein [Pimelobacter]KAB2812933.1 (2Fe-2S)-binding protein [Pimelobacter simplex]MBU2695444.1 hypothetical protein [Pimelobacter sp. 30-1]UUW91181.1 (2Fe-2S)-binding protein [Pimelobacter simplex]UUW95009.1 (2Fe-2S)-binding protein [Pimelobacter simplex]
MTWELNVNGVPRTIEAPPSALLVDVLRDELGLVGTKVGCGIGYCGACTVHLDGKPVHACCVIAGDCEDAAVETIEQVSTTPCGRTVVDAFAENGAIQCGFCTPGFVMSTTGLLAETPAPDEAEVRDYLVGNICRCTGFTKIVAAVCDAAGREQAR